ncbi:MAG TPA: methyltransferase domain-containing protein [Alphaproteobacteria bacterium]|jgi:SAM-dependent methyltransferase|nr:methyltransferase domain-containing protein [Alphaproteobacteria bacterium]
MAMSDALKRWNARFSAPGYVFGTAPNLFLTRQARRLKRGQRALAIADGEGRNGIWLAQQGLTVTSVDFSPIALEKARTRAAELGVALELVEADLVRWTWPKAAFDVVAGIFFQFAAPAERAAIFRNIKAALKPGGLVLIEGYGPKQLEYKTGGPGVLENLYTEALLREAFADFEILELRAYDAEISEGEGHKGMSALVDLVARKSG